MSDVGERIQAENEQRFWLFGTTNFWDGDILFTSQDTPTFLENGIPEIQNLDVIPPYRKRGVGSQLIDAIEHFAFNTYEIIGIGFGLYVDYETAQRMYVKRGYIPDGRGLMYDNQPVTPGGEIRIDDDLVLFLTKEKPK